MSIGEAWGAIRTLLYGQSFNGIKDIVGAAGLPVLRLQNYQQTMSGPSKGELLTAIDGLVVEMDPSKKDRFVTFCVAELLLRSNGKNERLEELLARFGWGIAGSQPYPLQLQINLSTQDLPDTYRIGMENAVRRYRDDDHAGAITAICGVVDQLTQLYFQHYNLGNHKDASYGERVTKSYQAIGDHFQNQLVTHGVDSNKAKMVWQNQLKSVGQAGFVLASYRQEFSDAHGGLGPKQYVQRSMDCAVFIVRCLADFT